MSTNIGRKSPDLPRASVQQTHPSDGVRVRRESAVSSEDGAARIFTLLTCFLFDYPPPPVATQTLLLCPHRRSLPAVVTVAAATGRRWSDAVEPKIRTLNRVQLKSGTFRELILTIYTFFYWRFFLQFEFYRNIHLTCFLTVFFNVH